MSEKLKLIVYVLLLLFCMANMIWSVQVCYAQSSKHIKVGVSIVEPWKFVQNGRFQGAGMEMFQEIAQRLQFEVEYIDLPFKRALEYMETGEIDMLFGLLRSPEREEFIYYIEPPYKRKSNKAFYVISGQEDLIIKHEDLYGLKVGVKLGANYFPQFDRDDKIQRDAVADYTKNIEKLLLGRIDTFICTDSQADYLIRSMKLQGKIHKARYEYTQDNPAYIGISKNSALMEEKKNIETVVSEMVESGDVDRIFVEYFNRNRLPIPEYR